MSWHAGVLQGAEKFMTSWHKEEEEVSRQRVIQRGDNEPTNSLCKTLAHGTGGEWVGTAWEESKREEADRAARHVAD